MKFAGFLHAACKAEVLWLGKLDSLDRLLSGEDEAHLPDKPQLLGPGVVHGYLRAQHSTSGCNLLEPMCSLHGDSSTAETLQEHIGTLFVTS